MSQIPLPREAEHEVADTNTPVPEVEIYPDSGDESPTLSRTISHGSSSSSTSPGSDDWEIFPPLDKITVFDVLDQLALPQRLEKLNKTVLTQREKLRKRQDTFTKTYRAQKDKVMRKAEVEKLVKKYNDGLDKVLDMWNDTKVVSMTEKASFVVGVSNVFITGYLMAGYPQWVHLWYSLQLIYFLPIRYVTYHAKGYHYFLADLCYFVNLLLMLSIWLLPHSRRLLISTYCLSYGNNAWAIAMWRNSLVFHSLDKVTSLFIHIMPPLVLHTLLHLSDPTWIQTRFPAVHNVKNITHYTLGEMIIWATVPYAIWQLAYHYLITVRRRDKIAAGRPTSFTWLKKSYAKNWLGKIVLSLPDSFQEPAFMGIQYGYAVVTMLPCTLWFYNAKLSGCFVAAVALWSVYNGATFYIDVFGMRFQRELEQLKKEAVKWQTLAQEMETKSAANTPLPTPSTEEVPMVGGIKAPHMKGRLGTSGVELSKEEVKERSRTTGSLPLEQ